MQSKTIISAIGIMLGLTLFAGPNLQANTLDKKTIITFHEPMEIPGMVLPAGEYVVKRADGSLPNVIRFSSMDETEVFATVHAIPTQRSQASDKVEIVTEERPTGSPEAIKKWFYPGELTGAEFVYPKSGNLLASATPPVLFPSDADSETEPALTLPAEEPEEAGPAAEIYEPLEAQPSEEPVEIAQAQPPPRPQTGATQAQPAPARQQAPSGQGQAPDELPQTATSLTLASMLGGLAVLGGAILRRFSRRLS